MIKIKNLKFTYPGANVPSLNNISLDIEKGDFLAIVGNNGCGKSTLCKTLNGLIPHFFSGDFEGEVEVDGKNTKDCSVGELAFKIGYVYQDFENQIVRPTVLDDASFACLNYAMEDYLVKGREALRLMGLLEHEKDYVWQLSGGQKHLLALAGMAALCPQVLILDEPVAQLDPLHAKQIYEVLKKLVEEHGKTVIVIEHHTEFIAQYCNSMVMMKEGQILWKSPVKEGLNRIDELIKCNIFPPQVTLAAKRLMDLGQVEKTALLPITLEEGRLFFKNNFMIQKKSPIKNEKRGKQIIRLEEVEVEYLAVKGKAKKIFDSFSLEIYSGEKIALIGGNGAGKSTLLKLITGLLKPGKGKVEVFGISTKATTPEVLAQSVSLVYQNPEEMFIKDSIRGDIEYAMKVRGMENYLERTEELLSMFGLKELEERDGRLLSGGQMRRASLAVGIALKPGVLLLDEPTANLDIATRKEIMKTLDLMKDKVETAIIATHDMQLVCEWADRIIVLNNARLIADGNREEIFGNELIVEKAGLKPTEIYSLGKMLSPMAECFTIEEFVASYQNLV